MRLFNDKVTIAIRSACWSLAAVLILSAIPFAVTQWNRPAFSFPQPELPPTADPRYRGVRVPVVALNIDRDHDVKQRARTLTELTKYGTPTSNYRFVADGPFLIADPDRTRVAPWALEVLTAKSVQGHADRDDDKWIADESVPIEWRAVDTDYVRSGWDRGHLLASKNHAITEKSQSKTFSLRNAMPQTPELNRGLWRKLEEDIRQRLLDQEALPLNRSAHVLTIALWVKDERNNICARTIGGGIWCPTHCAKAALWVTPNQRPAPDDYMVECWIISNDGTVKGTLDDYRVSGDELEAVAGLDLFAGLPDDVENKLEARP